METANVMVALGGDRKNTVPRSNVTAAEAAVLRVIHGDDAVFDVEIVGTVARTHRQEIGRLTEVFGKRDPSSGRLVSAAVSQLFPGAAARVFETFDELEIDESFYLARPQRAAKPAPQPDPLDHDGDGRKGGSLPDDEREDLGVDGMTVNELRAHADKIGCDLAGVTRKADILEAVKLFEAEKAKAAVEAFHATDDDGEDEDGVGKMPDDNMFA